MIEPRITLPENPAMGSVIAVETLMRHEMETGLRMDPATGERLPRRIVHSFVAMFNGREVFRSRLHPAIAANPYISFFMRVTGSGNLDMEWSDDAGETWRARRRIEAVG